jgi:hypothetical protein
LKRDFFISLLHIRITSVVPWLYRRSLGQAHHHFLAQAPEPKHQRYIAQRGVGIRESSVEFNGFDRSSFGPWASPQAELHDTYSDSIKRPPCLNTPVRYSAHPPELAENTTPLFLANEAYLRGVHELHGLTAEIYRDSQRRIPRDWNFA